MIINNMNIIIIMSLLINEASKYVWKKNLRGEL